MIMTNWCSSMMVEHFGMDYLERGELRTKFIKPVYLGADGSRARPRARGRAATDGGVVYALDVWCEDENGVKVTDGDAKVEVRRALSSAGTSRADPRGAIRCYAPIRRQA